MEKELYAKRKDGLSKNQAAGFSIIGEYGQSHILCVDFQVISKYFFQMAVHLIKKTQKTDTCQVT